MIVVLAFALLPVGCKKDSDSPTSPGISIPAAMVGTWTLQSVMLNGQPQDVATFFNFVQGAESATIRVESAGGYTYTEYDGGGQAVYTNGGTMAVSGANFTITVNSENGQSVAVQTQTGTWAITGSTLTLTVGPAVITAVK